MNQLLVYQNAILGIDPVDVGASFDLGDLLIAKASIVGYSIVNAELPADYAPGKYTWDNGLVPVPPSYTLAQLAEIRARLSGGLQAMFEAQAKALDYASQDRLAGYATSAHPRFGAEARAYVAWRDSIFDAAHAIELAVLMGERLLPTEQAFFAELPVYVQPEGLPPLPEVP